MNFMSLDPYRVLGISYDATEKEIKRAYRKMVKQYHSDAVINLSEEEKRRATDMILNVNAAYEILSDKNKKRELDETIKRATEQTSNIFYESFDDGCYDSKITRTKGEPKKSNKQKGNFRYNISDPFPLFGSSNPFSLFGFSGSSFVPNNSKKFNYSEKLDEIENIYNEIKEIKDDLLLLDQKIKSLFISLESEYSQKLDVFIRKLKEDPKYLQACDFIANLSEKDRFLITRLLISKKQLEKYHEYKEYLKNINDKIEEERIRLEEEKQQRYAESNKEKARLRQLYLSKKEKLESLENLHKNHPLFESYEQQIKGDFNGKKNT